MARVLACIAAIAAFAVHANAGAVELNEKTFEDAIDGKGAFIKFLAPWCGHCKSMKPAWDKLGDEYKDSKTVLIGDVDCTKDESKKLCEKYGVRGYPTIKTFTGNPQGDDYKGGRDFDALSKFAKESLGPSCGPNNMDLCDAEEKKAIEELQAKDLKTLEAEVEALDAEVKAADEELQEMLKGLQAQFEAGKEKKETTEKELMPKLGKIRSVIKAKKA